MVQDRNVFEAFLHYSDTQEYIDSMVILIYITAKDEKIKVDLHLGTRGTTKAIYILQTIFIRLCTR